MAATLPDELRGGPNSASEGEHGNADEPESGFDALSCAEGDCCLPEINPYDKDDTYYPYIGAMRTFDADEYTADTYNPIANGGSRRYFVRSIT